MDRKQSFLEKKKDHINQVVGEYKNEYGELFLLYEIKGNAELLFVTGDEFDWEEGYVFFPQISLICEPFAASPDEMHGLKGVVANFIRKSKS